MVQVIILAAVLGLAGVAELTAQTPQWIWHGDVRDGGECYTRVCFELTAAPTHAHLYATGDDHFSLFVNGHQILTGDAWHRSRYSDIARHLKAGANVIAIRGRNNDGPAGLAAQLELVRANGTVRTIVTGDTWQSTDQAQSGWTQISFDDSAWTAPVVFGAVGQPGLPWSPVLLTLIPDSKPIVPQRAALGIGIEVKSGFRVEQVFKVPRHMGSLVSMCVDNRGRLFVSDERRGLFCVTPAKLGDPEAVTQVERVDVDLGGAQGLLWAFDSLYAVVNGHGSGLYRLRDTDGDDRLDTVILLRALVGSGEHGPHAVILAPDGEHLLVTAGNYTDLTEIVGSRLPQNWGEDLLLPRQWDTNGHARGRFAPGGGGSVGWIRRDGVGFLSAADFAISTTSHSIATVNCSATTQTWSRTWDCPGTGRHACVT